MQKLLRADTQRLVCGWLCVYFGHSGMPAPHKKTIIVRVETQSAAMMTDSQAMEQEERQPFVDEDDAGDCESVCEHDLRKEEEKFARHSDILQHLLRRMQVLQEKILTTETILLKSKHAIVVLRSDVELDHYSSAASNIVQETNAGAGLVGNS